MDIIDVTDFTQTLQKSVTENLAPEFNAIKTDIVKKFQEAILEGNYDIAIETVGDDKVKALNQNLAGSSTYFEQIRKFSEELKGDLSSHVSKSDQLAEIGKKRTDITNSIAERQTDLKEVTEQTIPGIQLQLEKEQEALLLLNVKDSAYDSQKDKVKQIEETLSRANTKVADYIGQIEAATHFRDTELATLEQIANTTGVSSDRSSKLNQHLHKQVKLSDDNLKKNQELLGILEKQGDAKKKLVEQAQPILEEYEGMLDGISQGIDGFFGKFPLVGGMLSAHLKKPLEEATDLAKKSLRKAFLDAADAADKGAGSLGAMAAGTKSLVSGIAGMGKAVIGALLNPFTLVLVAVGGLLFLLKSAFDQVSRLQGASKEFRMEMGASAFQVAGIRDQVEQIERSSKNGSGLGLDVKELYAAVGAFSDVNAAIDHASANQVEFVARMEQTLGVSAATTTSAMSNLMKLGATARGEAEGLVMEMQTLSQKHGVKYAQVMEDVSSAGEDALIFAKGSAKALASGAIHARRMGSSLEDVASSAEALLDFEGSINSEMQASTMFGRQLHLQGLRQAAMAGDANAMLEERHKIMDSLGGLENMNRFQQKALAEAMGTTVGELMNMNKAREQERMLQNAANAGEAWAEDAMARRNKAKEEENMTAIDKLKLMELENKKAESIEAMQTRIKELMYKISTALVPLVEKILPKIEGFFQSFVKTGIGVDGKQVTELSDRGNDLKDTIMGIGSAIESIGTVVMSVGAFFSNFFGHSLITNLIVITGLFVGLKVVLGLINGFASSLTSKLFKGGGGGKKGSGILGRITTAINRIKPSKLFAVAGSIFILSGAMYVAAKAFQEFGKVNWKNAWPGLAVIAALAVAAKAMSKGSTAMIKGALAIGVLSIALIPLAFALNMMKGVGIETVFVVAGALIVLGVAAMKLGAIMSSGVGAAAILLGAVAIAALGASLIPLAYALNLATPGIEAFGKVFLGFASIMVKALEAIIGGIIEFAKVVGGVIVKVFQTVGGIIESVGNAIANIYKAVFEGFASLITSVANAISDTITSVGDAIVGVVTAIGDAISGVINSISGGISGVINSIAGAVTSVTDDIIRLSGVDSKKLTQASDAIWEMSKAMAAMGGASAINGLGNAVGGLGNGVAEIVTLGQADTRSPFEKILEFADRAESLGLATTNLDALMLSFQQLNGLEAILEPAGDAIASFSNKLLGMQIKQAGGKVLEGASNAAGAFGNKIASVLGAGDTKELNKSPLQKILDFANQAQSIVGVSDGLDLLLTSFEKMSNMETVLTRAAEALKVFGDALITFGAGAARATGGGLTGFIGGLLGQDQESPVDKVIDLIAKLGSVDINVESFEMLSNLNLGGFLNNVTDDFEDKIEMVSDGLGDFFNVFESVQPTTIASIERISGGLTKLLNGLSRSLPKIKTSDSKNLVKVADGLDEFFNAMDEVNTSKIKILPEIGVSMIPFITDFSELPLSSISEDISSIMNDLGDGIYQFFDELAPTDLTILPNLVEINAGITPFITNFATIPLSSISEDVHSIMNNVGDGIFQFFDELAPTDLTILPHLVTIQQGMIPFLKAFAQAPLPSEGFDSILIDLGKGVEQFADYVNDGEAGKINTFFKQTGAAFPKFIESMSKLSSIGDLSIVNKLTTLSDISNTLNLENVNKLKTFTSEVVDAINSFSGIQDPAVEALSAITSELYMLCDVIEKLDVDKLGGLQNINLGGVQTPIKIPARKSEQQIIEGTIGPKLMMTEMADLPVVDVAGGSLPPSDPFATPGPSLADVFSTPIAETQVQQVSETGTTSLAEVFSTPTTETQVQQVTETGTTSLADVFSSPPPEIVTEQKPEISILKNEKIKDAKKVNEMVQPIVDVVGSIYTKFIPESIKQKFSDFAKNEYFNLDEDHSMEAYKRSLGVNESVTNNILGDMGVMSAKDASTLNSSNGKITENEFTSSIQYEKVAQSTGLLDQIMAGVLRKELPTKLYAEGQLVGINTDTNRRMYEDEDGFTKVEETTNVSVTDVSDKLANSAGSRIKMLDEAIINGTTLENDSLNKLLESRRQQLTDEGRLVVNKTQSQVEPINNRVQPSANQPTIQSQVEPMNAQLQETATAPTNMLTKIADFTSNLIPDFSLLDVFSDVDKPESSTNIELSGLDTISVKGHNIFVEEIAKIVGKDTPSVESEKTEDGSKVVKKLDELILLMRKGGISVNMDGRKVSRAVASAHDQ